MENGRLVIPAETISLRHVDGVTQNRQFRPTPPDTTAARNLDEDLNVEETYVKEAVLKER